MRMWRTHNEAKLLTRMVVCVSPPSSTRMPRDQGKCIRVEKNKPVHFLARSIYPRAFGVEVLTHGSVKERAGVGGEGRREREGSDQ